MMRALLLMIVGGMVFSSPVRAGGDFAFSFTGTGGDIDDDFVSFFSLQMDSDAAGLPAINEITSLQLEITGLSHQTPEDLDIFLLSPSFTGDRGRILIMSDKGGATDLSNVTLTFVDPPGGVSVPVLPDDGQPLMSGTFPTEGRTSGIDLGFASDMFVGGSGGHPLDWILVFVDDTPGDTGSFQSFTLSGTAVPEPVTLSLLALGALMTLRRKRR